GELLESQTLGTQPDGSRQRLADAGLVRQHAVVDKAQRGRRQPWRAPPAGGFGAHLQFDGRGTRADRSAPAEESGGIRIVDAAAAKTERRQGQRTAAFGGNSVVSLEDVIAAAIDAGEVLLVTSEFLHDNRITGGLVQRAFAEI